MSHIREPWWYQFWLLFKITSLIQLTPKMWKFPNCDGYQRWIAMCFREAVVISLPLYEDKRKSFPDSWGGVEWGDRHPIPDGRSRSRDTLRRRNLHHRRFNSMIFPCIASMNGSWKLCLDTRKGAWQCAGRARFTVKGLHSYFWEYLCCISML